MYELSVYPITPSLWRWEIRCGGALLRCGTAPSHARSGQSHKAAAGECGRNAVRNCCTCADALAKLAPPGQP
jgi:hypothetical protein